MIPFWTKVKVKDHPTLHEFFGKDQVYHVVNFRPIVKGERYYLIQPENVANKYRVEEANLEVLTDQGHEWIT